MLLRGLRGAQADDQGVLAEPIAEDRQPGEDGGQAGRDRGNGDHRDPVADLKAARGGEEREPPP
ncbi:MAG: hypothetical protein ACXVHJ_32575 [Solirubrobacteraceae bacterium]